MSILGNSVKWWFFGVFFIPEITEFSTSAKHGLLLKI